MREGWWGRGGVERGARETAKAGRWPPGVQACCTHGQRHGQEGRPRPPADTLPARQPGKAQPACPTSRRLTRNCSGAHRCSSSPWIITRSPAVMPAAAAAPPAAPAAAAAPATVSAAAGAAGPRAAASMAPVMPAARMMACPALRAAAARSRRTTEPCGAKRVGRRGGPQGVCWEWTGGASLVAERGGASRGAPPQHAGDVAPSAGLIAGRLLPPSTHTHKLRCQ